MAYIEFIIDKNMVDTDKLKKLQKNLPIKLKELKIEITDKEITYMDIEEYYFCDDYSNLKNFAKNLSKVLKKGQIQILISDSEDDYRFVIRPGKVKFYIKEWYWAKLK